jgi:hypothetical protein
MAITKKQSITQTKHVMLTISDLNKKALAYFERQLMKESHASDCLSVANSDIINEAINFGYECARRKDINGNGYVPRM